MKKINVGKVVTTHGVCGDVKIYPHTNVEDMFSSLKKIYIGDAEYNILSVKYAKGCPVLKLDGISTVENAQTLIGSQVFAEENALPELEKDSFYLKDIIGCIAIDEKGERIGKISDVIFTGANDVYQISGDNGRDILVPAVKEFILNVDIDKKEIVIKLIEGM
ncbi:MAG: ribosome maturation factor RimM [Monoglobales bacterium]